MDSYKYISLSGTGQYQSLNNWNKSLYIPDAIEKSERKKIKMIPYFLWANRKLGEMRIWFNAK